MARVSESATVSAPPQKVYDFVSEATRATTFIPGLTRINNVKPPQTSNGQTWDYEFDWFGLVVSGNSKCTRHDPPKVYEFKTITGNPSTWTFEPQGQETKLTLEVDYNVPQNMLARFASQSALEKQNQQRAKEIVQNIKALVEG